MRAEVVGTCPSTVLAAGDTTETRAGRLPEPHLHSARPLGVQGHQSPPSNRGLSPHWRLGHGGGKRYAFKAVTDPEGVVTAYPQGEASPNLGPAWTWGPAAPKVEPSTTWPLPRPSSPRSRRRPASTPNASMRSASRWAAGCPTTSLAMRPMCLPRSRQQSFDLLKGMLPRKCGIALRHAPSRWLSFRGTGDNVALYAGGYSTW